MIFSKKITGNSRVAVSQFSEVQALRNASNDHELTFKRQFAAHGMTAANAGFIPRDVYIDFDRQTVEVMNPVDENVMLADLIPFSKSLSIGKLTSQYSKTSDAGSVQTSMDGRTGVKMDNTEKTYDGSIIPITDTGFDRNWREVAAGQSEAYDAMIDDQRETLLTFRRSLQDQLLNGHKDKDGNLIVVDGLSWAGLRADTHVEQVDLGAGGVNFDFTDTTKTYAEIEAKVKVVRDIMLLTNKCGKELTWYVSNEIASNWERASSESYDSVQILQRLSGLRGIKEIKGTSDFTGNEFAGYPLDGENVKPLVGMATSTIAMPRPMYNSPYAFVTAAGIGFQVRDDYNGNTCAFSAKA